jgi:hypothetical protein
MYHTIDPSVLNLLVVRDLVAGQRVEITIRRHVLLGNEICCSGSKLIQKGVGL